MIATVTTPSEKAEMLTGRDYLSVSAVKQFMKLSLIHI